jgi:alkylhydroperoxidase family enzyme
MRRNPSAFLSTTGMGPDSATPYTVAEVREGGDSVYYIVEAASGRRLLGPWSDVHEASRQFARLTGNIDRVRGTPFSVTPQEKYMRFNPRRTDIDRKPSSRQVQARSAMRPERELAQFDAAQAAHSGYIAGQHARHDASMAKAIQTLNNMIAQFGAVMKQYPKPKHLGVAMSMVYESDPLWDNTMGDYYNRRMMAEYIIASATGDSATADSLRPHVLGLFADTRAQAPIYQQYPSVRGAPRQNPKDRFRSARAAKRGARGAAASQAAIDEHYEQVSHDLAEAREEKIREDRYRQEARLMDSKYPSRDY